MQGTCPNPGCGAIYTLTADNIGRQFACRKCHMQLRVEADGLHPATEPAASNVSAVHSLSPDTPLDRVRRAVFDYVFGLGAILVILFTFFPVLDQLHNARYRADIKTMETIFHREDRDRTTPPPADMKKIRDKKIAELTDIADDHEAGLMYNGWWYGWGILLGFLMLAIASIAWLRPDESRTHRVVAAIVICTELLLVFIVYVARSQSALRL